MKTVPRLRPLVVSLFAKKHLLVLVSAVLLVVAVGGVLALQNSTADKRAANAEREAKLAQAEKLEQDLKEAAKKEKEQTANTKTNVDPQQPASAPTATTPKTKYSTSSDPRSTAYSTTPPAPNPASFTTNITHNGQVAPGTLVSYNATKGEKAYYGGDLLASPAAITLSRSTLHRATITITVPDGAEVRMPSEPWDDQRPYFGIGMDISEYKPSGTSFNMVITPDGALPANGTYTLHISTNRTGQAADAWYYHRFITITVTD